MVKKFLEIIKPNIFKVLFTLVLAVILLFQSNLFATFGGEMIESGFPLHYQKIISCMPTPSGIPCQGSTEIFYVYLTIDILFWTIVSYAIVSGINLLFTRRRKGAGTTTPNSDYSK